MGLFKRSSQSSGDKMKVKITHEDEKRLKMRSANVHDPILDAVNEAQPFEESANEHQRQSSLGDAGLRDVFGNTIVNPDISNPSRSRDERPMDTIRSFEYSVTGDPTYKQQLETPTLGWRVRQDFPLYTGNQYAQGYSSGQQQLDEYGQPTYDGNAYQRPQTSSTEQGVYTAPPPKEPEKKKRGLFGRKKN
ncbi:hypothetical protein KL930_001958 [Ogataea haglerorum]|uniref:Uncharacterized protein n=1 Tax=Ogataea haglerorum TaxID=1937702 RepID=A0AAN6I2W3_9ASCO|nr:uncharacterized protein KL911_001899 [Ogataea haglerorum]KAG7698297.1 hypothetical protein KL915_002014 [Ogataea haglerorum]KAG7710453.1 hypothetical protein KL950_001366 [Ogataea haglerorum]KAG7721077.1 hypothetical protein KL913_000813 [Ogataea haglerorum]KAG7721831.1 hypothetical protein KL949_000809 [Ogataea haglerorum]KAG7730163.1 hypothetical protein KL933_001243 [Ogataea haglerorum]